MIVDVPKHSLLDIIHLIYPTLQENGETLSDATLAELTESADRLALLLLDDITVKSDDKKALREHRSSVGGNYFSTSPYIRHLFFSLATKSTLYDKSTKAHTELGALLYLYALLTFASGRTKIITNGNVPLFGASTLCAELSNFREQRLSSIIL